MQEDIQPESPLGRAKCRYYPTEGYYPKKAYAEALRLIAEAVQDERGDELFYDYLLSKAPSEEQRAVIAAIRDDERKHQRMFRQLYCELTGKAVPPGEPERFEPPRTYLEGIERALFGELRAVEMYRRILFGLKDLAYRNMVTEIWTDELKHACKWNFLYTLNTCRDN
ncbi:MAG: ferritin-like domain-containing protein [Clostridia bacterium]|jgi:rubrerythrin|nr:ferritin-like domain-containing protein [Clostridia bacterium]MDH7573204.1 ferritin-like domain-containing protein [Clostridia bacterium]